MAGLSRQLLAISWAMPPAVYPRSIQVARSLKALTGFGWHTIVICAEPPPGTTLDPELQREYEKHYRAVRIDPERSDTSWWQRWRRPAAAGSADPEARWIAEATAAAAAAARRQRPAAVVSFAQPWSDHRVGLRVSTNAGLPWVAHFSDPWADNPYADQSEPARSAARDAEREVIARADAIVFTTRRIADLVMGKYPREWDTKVHIVPHGFEPEADQARSPSSDDTLRLVYAGDFYGIRTPAGLIEALARINAQQPLAGRLEMSFVGLVPETAMKQASDAGLDGVVRFCGRMAYSQCAAIARGADALLVIDAPGKESVFLPSKLIDYLGYARPMVGLTPANGASADLLRRLDSPVVEPTDSEAIAAVLGKLMDERRAGTLRLGSNFREVARDFEIGRTTDLLNAAIQGAIERKAAA